LRFSRFALIVDKFKNTFQIYKYHSRFFGLTVVEALGAGKASHQASQDRAPIQTVGRQIDKPCDSLCSHHGSETGLCKHRLAPVF
jgi:hypothetical protein